MLRHETYDKTIAVERRCAEVRPSPAVRESYDPDYRPGAALTRREHRVKQILLKELQKMSPWSSLSYDEKQRLDKSLDHAYIDRELEKMSRWERSMRRWVSIAGPLLLATVGWLIWTLLDDGSLTVSRHLNPALLVAANFIQSLVSLRSLRRKRFIYEALRELSDADEADVVLDRITRDADALIRRIVDRELETEVTFPLRSRRLN